MCDNPARVYDDLKSEMKVQTTLKSPLPLDRLCSLLSIVMEETSNHIMPFFGFAAICTYFHMQDCRFSGAAIYGNLVIRGRGIDIVDAPGELTVTRAPGVRAKIRRSCTLFANLL